ncbi:MAG TPA: hypothetical protein VLA13_05685 [Massilibacterium sp.]|nr:hypothetical protein [Massilibacterium sp.]
MIPTIELRTKFPYCREFASSPVAIDPSYDRGIEERTDAVTLEYAAFLINQGELDEDDYIGHIMENIEASPKLYNLFELLEDGFGHDGACTLIEYGIEGLVRKAVENDNSGWEDYEN